GGELARHPVGGGVVPRAGLDAMEARHGRHRRERALARDPATDPLEQGLEHQRPPPGAGDATRAGPVRRARRATASPRASSAGAPYSIARPASERWNACPPGGGASTP